MEESKSEEGDNNHLNFKDITLKSRKYKMQYELI